MRISDWSSDVCSSDLAAGAVGSAAGQIANIHGCRTIGITSSATKQRLCIEQFGYEAAIDYRSEDVDVRLAELCPDGIDIYYDNTAGAISDADRKSTRLNSSHYCAARMPPSACNK